MTLVYCSLSLIPRPLPERERAWYTAFAHASNFPCDIPYNFQNTLLSMWVMYGTIQEITKLLTFDLQVVQWLAVVTQRTVDY